MEMVVGPPESELQGGVKVGDVAVAPDQNPAPDQRADAPQHHPELVDEGIGKRGFGRPAILLLVTSPTLASRALFRSPSGPLISPPTGLTSRTPIPRHSRQL